MDAPRLAIRHIAIATLLTIVASAACRRSRDDTGSEVVPTSRSLVTDLQPVVRINAGGSEVSPYAADSYYSGASYANATGSTIDVSGVVNPAPMAVYQRSRDSNSNGSFDYTLTGLTPGNPYTVRLHFADSGMAFPSKRIFDVSVNGVLALPGYDIIVRAGRPHKAVAEHFSTTADSTGKVTIHFHTIVYSATVNAIELLAGSAEPIAPMGLRALPADRKVDLSWKAVTGAASYRLYRSTISGAQTLLAQGLTQPAYLDDGSGSGLTNGTTYFYVVTAVNEVGESVRSAEVSAAPTSGAAPVFRINAGGHAVGPYSPDNFFSNGSNYSLTTQAVDTSAVIDPAPMSSYQTGRHAASAPLVYTFTGLTPGSPYTVRLHFAETTHSFASQRVFDVSINGTTVLPGYDIVARAGGRLKATAEQFNATADPDGRITVRFQDVVYNASVSAIEILTGSIPAIPPLAFRSVAGDRKVNLVWNALPGATGYNVYRSTASGAQTLHAQGLTEPGYVDDGNGGGLANGTTYYYKVTASNAVGESVRSGEVSATPTTGPAPVYRINAGGAAVGPYSGDQFFSPLGNYTITTGSVDIAGVLNPAPMSVYQIGRYSSNPLSYTIPGLTPGDPYTIRLHFAESSMSFASQRVFDVSINGTTVLPGYDIVARAGRPMKAVVEQFSATAGANGTIAVDFRAVVNNPLVNAVEVLTGSVPLISPLNVRALAGDRKVSLVWNALPGATSYNIYRSTVSGAEAPYAEGVTEPRFVDDAGGAGLTNGTTYYYKVAAVNGLGRGDLSPEVPAVPTTGPVALYRINAGGPAVPPFAVDQFFTGSNLYPTYNTIATAGVADAAPMAVYQVARYDSNQVRYVLDGLAPAAAHTVRLHFAELSKSSAGGRVFNVVVNGATAFSNYDIFARAGGAHKAKVERIDTISDAAGKVVVELNRVVDRPFINGIELLTPFTDACWDQGDGAGCSDSSVCTTDDRCLAGSCRGTAIDCGDNQSCTDDTCDRVTGCRHTPSLAGTPCDDGDVCRLPSVCSGGNCVASNASMDGRFCGSSQCDARVCGAGVCQAAGPQNGDVCVSAPVPTEDFVNEANPAAVLAQASVETAPPGSEIVGATPGAATVTDTGEALYTVPLWSPPGRLGIEPHLALEYRSRAAAGQGVLGPRWSLGGLSVIRRCPRSESREPLVTESSYTVPPVSFFDVGNPLCLDGQRLVPVSSLGEQVGGEFREEENPFNKIVITAVDELGPLTFKVMRKDSSIAYYGRAADSRVEGPQYERATVLRRVRYAWLLDRIEDRQPLKNFLEVAYSPPSPPTDPAVEEPRPVEIRYTGSGDQPGQRAVHFSYRAFLPTRTRYVRGLRIDNRHILDRVEMTAPGAVIVRSYRLGYDGHTGTGRLVLKTVTECDSERLDAVCKAPTSFTWQNTAGFQDLPLDITDPGESRLNRSIYGIDYRRIIAADLNGDGKDDILYRAAHEDTSVDCYGWYSRLSTGTGFGPRQYHRFSREAYEGCPGTAEPAGPTGQSGALIARMEGANDPVPVDIDRDGRIDIVMPNGMNDQFYKYFAYFNDTALSGWTQQRDSFNPMPLDEGGPRPYDPSVLFRHAGYGSPLRIYRPYESAPHGWGSRVITSAGAGSFQQNQTPSWVYRRAFTLDLDGDGAVELISRDSGDANIHASLGGAYSNSAAQEMGIPKLEKDGTSYGKHWFADLNGDGLKDVVWLDQTAGADPTVVSTQLNTGNGFATAQAQNLGVRIGNGINVDDGVRILDYNLDGREDLLLVDNESYDGAAHRTQMLALISDGMGGLGGEQTGIPLGDFADGIQRQGQQAPEHGFRTTQVLDANGDGLSDIITIRDGQLHLHLRTPQEPDIVSVVEDGRGVRAEFTYLPATDGRAVDMPLGSCQELTDLRCAPRGLWVVSEHKQTLADQTRQWSWTYKVPMASAYGDGFMGFQQVRSYDASLREEVVRSYEIPEKVNWGDTGVPFPHYVFAKKGRLNREVRAFWDERKRRTERTFTYEPTTVSPLGIFYTKLSGMESREIECTRGPNGGDCIDSVLLGRTTGTFGFDAYGNLWTSSSKHYDGFDRLVLEESRLTPFLAPNLDQWLIAMPDRATETSTPAGGAANTRVVDYDPDPATGILRGYVVQPDGLPGERLEVTLARTQQGQVETITRLSGSEARSQAFKFEHFDGVFPSSVTNAKGQETKLWLHPALGAPVRTRDPDGLLSLATYDRFGRIRSELDPASGLRDVSYTGSGQRLDVVTQVGGVRRAVGLDGLGRPVRSEWMDGSGNIVVAEQSFDAAGRTKTRRGPIGGGATPRNEDYAFDGAGRLLSYCHDEDSTLDMASMPVLTRECVTNTFTNNEVVSLDEALKKTKILLDALGRPETSIAYDGGREITTRHGYGAFGALERSETLGQPSVVLGYAFDALGRITRVTRSGAGTRSFGYNAFGDVVREARLDASDAEISGETVSYVTDQLGRPTSRVSKDGTSTFLWDQAPFGKGSLFRATGADGVVTDFSYNSRGLLERETVSVGGESFSIGRTYDELGRMDVLSYPTSAAEFSVVHEYHGLTGDLDRIARVQDGQEIWRAGRTNAAGQIEEEYFGRTRRVNRTHYPFSGRPWTKTSSAVGLTESLTYYKDGNIQERVRDGYRERFVYDGLDRIKDWYPNVNAAAPRVRYGFDDFGNLRSRAVADETITYQYRDNSVLEQLTAVRAGASSMESYTQDASGLLRVTPQGSLTYTSFDQPRTLQGSVGSFEFKYDAFGARITRANTGNGEVVLSLGSLYQRRTVGGAGSEHTYRVANAEQTVAEVTMGTSGTAINYLMTDNTGIVGGGVDHTGAAFRAPRRDPFGAAITGSGAAYLSAAQQAASGTSERIRTGITNHLHEAELGLVDMGARMYSPRLGRFLTADPVVPDPLSYTRSNPWSYAFNNPIRYYDPDGRNPDDWVGSGPPDPAGTLHGQSGSNDPAISGGEIATIAGIACALIPACRNAIFGTGSGGGERGPGPGPNLPPPPTPRDEVVVVQSTSNPSARSAAVGGGSQPTGTISAGSDRNGSLETGGSPTTPPPVLLAQAGGGVIDALKGLGDIMSGCRAGPCSSTARSISDAVSTLPWPTAGVQVEVTGLAVIGGGTLGLNLQLTPVQLVPQHWWFYTPGKGFNGSGFGGAGWGMGVSFGANVGLGYGDWSGPFHNVGVGFGALGGGYFQSGDGWRGWTSGPGYKGFSISVGYGILPGKTTGGYTHTEYVPIR